MHSPGLFPAAGGTMGTAIRSHDWSASPLGPIDAWPPILRTSLNIVLDSAFPSFLVWGPERILLYNDAYAEILCAKHPAALGRPFRAVWHEIWDVLGPLVERTLVGGESHRMSDIPLVMQRKGYAEHTWFTYSYGPVRTDAGEILGLLCNCIETTETILGQRRQAADAAVLREHESASREDAERVQLALAAGAIIGTWFWHLPTDRFTVDEAFARAFGLDPAIGRTGLSLAQVVATVHPDDQAGLAQAINTVISRGGHYAHQYRVRRADGRYYWIEANGRVDLAPDGTGLLFPGVLIDVEARRAVEAERDGAILKLRALNDQLEQKVVAQARARGRTWQLSPDILGVLDADGFMESSNPAWQATLGWTEDEVAATPFLDFIHPDDRAATETAWRDARDHGIRAMRIENRYRHQAGGWRWLSWVAVPDGGKVYCSARDISVERERQAELERAHEQLRHSQKMEAVGQLTGGLAHDFNNLLAGIAGSLDLVKLRLRQGRTDEIERYVAVAQGASRRAAALTHRLLAFSRRQTLAPRATCVNTLVDGLLDMIRRTVGPGVLVEPDYDATPWAALVDQSQLENALLNLCINARDAMPEGGRIVIATANRVLDPDAARACELPPGDYLVLSVADSGTGMAPGVLAKAFEPFFTTKPLGQGTGLGLSMIYGFARQSGGQVAIDSQVGQGTTVSIFLPRHRGAAEGGQAASAPEAAPQAGRGETILVVDDEPSVRMLVVDLLEDLGYQVLQAGDGAAGLALLQSTARIDLLVSDVGLPGMMNGRQMADAARIGRPWLKVLFITGYAEAALLDHGQLAPGMSVLTKPFSIEAMAQRARELLAR
ncbi:PAS domain-containing protein [Massilia sp. HP4]|uniref:PAS domain-containing protein n=1 Tax=Massilia sp. HP4 TaxID=2562316 RepID=UPI0010BF9D59|nr:PAS domain-containing protein [Massilia sp. HP4]